MPAMMISRNFRKEIAEKTEKRMEFTPEISIQSRNPEFVFAQNKRFKDHAAENTQSDTPTNS